MDKTTEERIKADAEAATNDHAKTLRANNMEYAAMIMRLFGYKEGYIEGATAENERAQKMADALEWIKTYGPVDELTVKFIDNTLEQWRGTGKEVEQKCTCRYPTFNAMTNRCLTCNRPYKV